jgi:hypothetical protein
MKALQGNSVPRADGVKQSAKQKVHKTLKFLATTIKPASNNFINGLLFNGTQIFYPRKSNTFFLCFIVALLLTL